MQLAEYLQKVQGVGILATANKEGEVDAAIFAPPRVLRDGEVAFVMRDRLTHKNLQANPNAHYLFMEEAGHHRGIRLFLRKTREETDPKLLATMTRRHLPPDEDKARGPKFLVFFAVTRILPLLGSGESPVSP